MDARDPDFGGDGNFLGEEEHLGKDLVKFLGPGGDLPNVKNEGVLYYIYIYLFIYLIKKSVKCQMNRLFVDFPTKKWLTLLF